MLGLVYNVHSFTHQFMISKLRQDRYNFFLLVILLSFPFWIGFLINAFSVNVPFWDEWLTPGYLFEKIHSSSGSLSFSDFTAQHNESRLVFPKFVFLAVAYFTHWDVRFGMFISLSMAFLVSINLCLIISRRFSIRSGQGGNQSLLLVGVSSMLVFSTAQYENWLWGIQIVYFIPILCLTTGISILYSRIKLSWKVVLTIILCTGSTFSYANGLVCWFLLPLTAVFLGQWHILKKHVELIIFWTLACASNLILYFWDYSKPKGVPSLLEGLFHPLKALNYLFAFLGSSLAGSNLTVASVVGLFLVLLTGSLGIFLLARWDNQSLRYRTAGWATLLLYSLISAIVATFGRMGFGIEQAMSSRYTTFSVYGIVGLLGLITIIGDEIQIEKDRVVAIPYWKYDLSLKHVTRHLPLSLAILLIVVNASLQSHYTNAMDLIHRDRLYSKTCLTYADFVQNKCITQSLYEFPDIFRKNLKAARELGILKKEDFAQDSKPPNVQNTVSDSHDHGWMDGIKPVSEDDFVASGWAILEDSGRTADAVLLSYQDDKGEPKIFMIAPVKLDRPDVSKFKQNSIYTRSGWSIVFSRSSLPNRKLTINAWAYDVKTKSSYLLNGSYSLSSSQYS